jgi:hypothetical protein
MNMHPGSRTQEILKEVRVAYAVQWLPSLTWVSFGGQSENNSRGHQEDHFLSVWDDPKNTNSSLADRH